MMRPIKASILTHQKWHIHQERVIKYSAFQIPESIIENNITYDPSQFLTYQCNIQVGNYTVDELLNEIEKESLSRLHGVNNINILEEKENNDNNIFEEPYYSFPSLRNSPHRWKFEFNKQNGALFCVNRIEEIDIFSIQTFYSNEKILTNEYFKKYDIFYNYSNLGKNYTLDNNYIYITIPLFQGVTDYWFDNSSEAGNTNIYPDNNYDNPFKINPFPLVISCDVNNSEKDSDLYKFMTKITMTTFYDLRLYHYKSA